MARALGKMGSRDAIVVAGVEILVVDCDTLSHTSEMCLVLKCDEKARSARLRGNLLMTNVL
ncbi:unnamed protein product [Dracunculus medinensis]|uniref:50S ribosomal protein L30e n=1 Tax=Dracunculus medinensis TaxID=318479 RepID=A0A0N4USB1_DRAME|nr:unnamed protein product [Dracunculus medinensis]